MPHSFTLRVWRQLDKQSPGQWERYSVRDASPDWSFLDLLDHLNDELIADGQRPIEFDHDCREGICGACGFLINGRPHGPLSATTVCQLHLRDLDPATPITLEPYRAAAFPVVSDLKVDRSALDRTLQAGGYISVNIGAAPEANSLLIARDAAQSAFAAAACIGCGACVASCDNASAALFTAAKTSHLGHLPQGQPEANRRVLSLVAAMDAEGFGHCSLQKACSAVCPQGIETKEIARMHGEHHRASWRRWLRLDG